MDTDTLISRLSENAGPVERLSPSWLRAVLWLAAGIPVLAVVVLIHGLDVSLDTLFSDRRLVIEELATLATALAAATAAFASTVPGMSRRWLWLPLVPLAIWLFSVGEGCVDELYKYGWAGLGLRIDTACFVPMAVTSIVPALVMVRMLRRGAPLTPRLSLVLGMLATAALVNFGLRLFHLGDVTFMVLVWHFGMLVMFAIGAGLLAPKFLTWGHLAARLPASVRSG